MTAIVERDASGNLASRPVIHVTGDIANAAEAQEILAVVEAVLEAERQAERDAIAEHARMIGPLIQALMRMGFPAPHATRFAGLLFLHMKPSDGEELAATCKWIADECVLELREQASALGTRESEDVVRAVLRRLAERHTNASTEG